MKDSHSEPVAEPDVQPQVLIPLPVVAPKLAESDETIRRRMVEEALLSEQLRSAIEAVLKKFRHRSYRWNELLAETDEITNEVARRALDRLSMFDPERARPLPWLMGFAQKILLERVRWNTRDSAHHVRQSAFSEQQWNAVLQRLSIEPRPADEPHPVWRALALLEPGQQRVLRLRYLEDRSYATIAQAFGISEEAARNRVCRALQALGRHLPPETNL